MESIDSKSIKKKPEARTRQEIYSKSIRAGKRTYFFDVKSTRNDEYYLTITESKRKFFDNGSYKYEKHKLFLYPEDFEKFSNSLAEIIQYIEQNQPEPDSEPESVDEITAQEPGEVLDNLDTELDGKNFTNIDFEDI